MGQQTQRRMKQTKMYVCTLVEFISSRCSHIAVHGWSDGYGWNPHWFIYTRNNRKRKMRKLLDHNEHNRHWHINRITIAWETVTWVN